MSSALQLQWSLMLQLFADVPSCPGVLLVCFLAVVEVSSPGSGPSCCGGVIVSSCWDPVSIAKNGSAKDTASHASSWVQNMRVKALAGLGVFSAAVICFVLKQVNPHGSALRCLCALYCFTASHVKTQQQNPPELSLLLCSILGVCLQIQGWSGTFRGKL